MSLVIARICPQLSISALAAPMEACTKIYEWFNPTPTIGDILRTILRGFTWGTIVLTARPSLRPSKSMKRRRQAS